MILWFLSARRRKLRASAKFWYAYCVNRARRAHYYANWQVPDTIDGRFDMITLHLSLLIIALRAERNRDAAFVQQALFDCLFQDMERNLREMGVGDLAVPKRIKKMMLAFNGRLHSYAAAIESKELLAKALWRNVYREQTVDAEILGLFAEEAMALFKEYSMFDFENIIDPAAIDAAA